MSSFRVRLCSKTCLVQGLLLGLISGPLAGTRTAAAGAPPRGGERTVWLDELDVSLSECGWNSTRSKRSVGGNVLKVGGKKYDRGIGTHAPGSFVIDLAKGSTRFTASVGIDDESGNNGTAEFIVKGDAKTLWKSGVMRGSGGAKDLDVDVRGVKILELVVTVAGDGYGNDHTDWVDAKLVYTGKKPRAYGGLPPGEERDETRQQYIFLTGLIRNRQKLRPLVPQMHRREWMPLDSERDPVDLALRRTRLLLEDIENMCDAPDLSAERDELKGFAADAALAAGGADDDARYALFKKVLALRRRTAFKNPLLEFDDILFIKRHFNPPSEKQGNHMCDQFFGFHAIRAGGLFVLEDAFGEKPKLRDVLADAVCANGRFKGRKLAATPPTGGFLSPDLSYDGKQILFAYADVADKARRYTWTKDNCYHVFKVNVDGTGLRQLTDGPWNDFDPCWMPNGRIVFMSERRGGYGRCHGRPVPTFTLHTMEPDGSDITCISFHETNEWHPSIDNDGMIVYTRWDYVDRGFNQAHHPWITTPDGRDARAIQGNYAISQRDRPHMEMDMRAIPGSRNYVTTAAGHHAQAYGPLVILRPRIEDDDKMATLKRLTPEQRFPEAEQSNSAGQKYATAWPLSEQYFLCVYDVDGGAKRGTRNRFGIYLIDAFGNQELLYRDPSISCLSPIPVSARPRPPVVPHMTSVGRRGGAKGRRRAASGEVRVDSPTKEDLSKKSPVALVNVYRGLKPWPKDTRIVALRIVQVLPKSTPLANRPRIGYGDQKNARAILGTVPVEEDGSAHFMLPVGRPVYFQALDAKGTAVQSMRSDVYVHPGERLTCQGCHEPRHGAPAQPPQGYPIAFGRAPSRIEPEVKGTNPISFPILVQPVLERNCVPCHVKSRSAGKKPPDLGKGNWQKNREKWYTSYNNLKKYTFYYNDARFTTPRSIPGKVGAKASKLYRMLAAGHNKLRLSDEDMHRIVLWLDTNCDFFGAYEDIEAQARGEVVKPSLE